jgi:hypothetical protein
MSIAHVQTVGGAAENQATVQVGPITTTSGNLIHVNLAWFDAQSFVSMEDSKGNAWIFVQERSNAVGGAAGSAAMRQMYAKNIIGGASHTFTLTISASGFPVISVTEISGADPFYPKDQHNADSQGSSPYSSGNITTSVSESIMCGAITADQAGSMPFTNDSDFIEQFEQATTAQFEGLLAETRILAASETNNYAGGLTVSPGNWVSMIVNYKEKMRGVHVTSGKFTWS